MSDKRIPPPETRDALTKKVSVADFTLYITVGFYPNKQPCEIFITISKEGSTLAGLMDCIAIASSFGLQFGVPWTTLMHKFRHSRFEPMDDHYSSVIDAVAVTVSDLIKKYGGNEEVGPEGKEINTP